MSGVLVRLAASEADRQTASRSAWPSSSTSRACRWARSSTSTTWPRRICLAVEDGRPLGTLRWRVPTPGTAKIERVAVLREARGLGLGSLLMDRALAMLGAAGLRSSVLNAQTAATDFYRRLGFVPEGEPFDEAGIEHVRMRRDTSIPKSRPHRAHAISVERCEPRVRRKTSSRSA